MKLQTYYDRKCKVWFAFMVDQNGNQVGNSQYGATKEYAAFLIGMEYASNQQKFAKPLSEILTADE